MSRLHILAISSVLEPDFDRFGAKNKVDVGYSQYQKGYIRSIDDVSEVLKNYEHGDKIIAHIKEALELIDSEGKPIQYDLQK